MESSVRALHQWHMLTALRPHFTQQCRGAEMKDNAPRQQTGSTTASITSYHSHGSSLWLFTQSCRLHRHSQMPVGGADQPSGCRAPGAAEPAGAAGSSTAAHHVLIGLVNQAPLTATLTADVKLAIKARLDAEYASSLAEIPAGQAKAKGIEVGAAAAAAMLANRAGDGRFGAPGFPFPASPGPGEWRPIPGKRSERMGAQRATVHPAEPGITFTRQGRRSP